MENIKKIGEIICNDGKFVDWVRENLENTGFLVRTRITSGFNTIFEIYEKTE